MSQLCYGFSDSGPLAAIIARTVSFNGVAIAMKSIAAVASLVFVSVVALAGPGGTGGAGGGGKFGGGGLGGGFGGNGGGGIVTADQGIRNQMNRSQRQNQVAAEKTTQTAINGKCDDEQAAWKVIAPKNAKNKNYAEAEALYQKAVDAFTAEKNKRQANSVCEQTLTKALELLK